MSNIRGRLRAAESSRAGSGADSLDAVFLVADDTRSETDPRVLRSGRLLTVLIPSASIETDASAMEAALEMVPNGPARTAMMSTTKAAKVYIGLDPERL